LDEAQAVSPSAKTLPDKTVKIEVFITLSSPYRLSWN
jgi:hypothetical protein